jgi:nicotinate-nucleotide adenylyltransferase
MTEPPPTDAQTVLLYGGTFDPPHVGHLTMAQVALEQTGVDEVWFLPAPSPPHKLDVSDDTFEWRLRMVEALISDCKGLRAMPLEAFLKRPSYTIDTVRAVQTWYPQVKFSFLLGTDALAGLPQWHGAEELSQRIDFVVAVREGFPRTDTIEQVMRELPSIRIRGIEMPLLDISSTWLRQRLETGRSVCHLIPPQVLDVWHVGPKGME